MKVSISKMVLVLFMLLMALVLQVQSSERSVLPPKETEGYIPAKVNAEISNQFTSQQHHLGGHGLEVKHIVSDEALPPKTTEGLFGKVYVDIKNLLTTGSRLTVHCKDKKHDLQYHTLNLGETYTFSVRPNFFMGNTLYFCHFAWAQEGHYFDIYIQDRDDYCYKDRCPWEISENGPCKIAPDNRTCFKWNDAPPVSS